MSYPRTTDGPIPFSACSMFFTRKSNRGALELLCHGFLLSCLVTADILALIGVAMAHTSLKTGQLYSGTPASSLSLIAFVIAISLTRDQWLKWRDQWGTAKKR